MGWRTPHPLPPMTVADKHDVTDEDVRADSYGEDYDYWSDVDDFRRSFFAAEPNQ